MIAFLQKNKSAIISVVVIIALIWVVRTFVKSESVDTTRDTAAQTVGSDVLSLYASLQSVTLDSALFSSPLYKHLTDFSTALPNQPSGRANPFDVIGRD